MCGINGLLRLSPAAPPLDREELLRTRERMAARGPDGAGDWVSPDGRAALASRRLAILDLSAAGDQPMASADGRLHAVLNGEIYNFRELRAALEREGRRFRSHSDTEVLLTLYAREGAAMLRRLRGMFGLALWDEAEQTLLLARDPLGVKPLYYAVEGGVLRFASQVKALEAGGAVSRAVEPAGLAGFLLWGSVPEPWTIRRGVRALPAGHRLLVRDGRIEGPAPFAVEPAPPREADGAGDAAAALADSVRAHLVSDVPVAVFLSAGLDSTLVAALASRAAPEPPTTFTLRFDVLAGTERDEGPLAAEVARRLGTRHVERTVRREDFLDLWPAALDAMDQPAIDGFNVFLVSKAAHEAGIKVALSGLGGDELFGGYPSFADVPRLQRQARRARRVPGLPSLWPAVARRAFGEPAEDRGRAPPRRHAARRLLPPPRACSSPRSCRHCSAPTRRPKGSRPTTLIADAARSFAASKWPPARVAPEDWLAVQRLETRHYLRNQLLRDADWAAMAHSLELRVPLVDAWLLARFAALGFEPARSSGKRELVRRAAPELPEAVFDRAKTGFYVPVVPWLAAGGEGPAAPEGLGAQSRQVALRVLAEHGVELAAGAVRAA